MVMYYIKHPKISEILNDSRDYVYMMSFQLPSVHFYICNYPSFSTVLEDLSRQYSGRFLA